MTNDGQRQAAQDELALADEELRAAAALLDADLPRVALTRVYFCVFHAMRARLYATDLEPKSHAGVQHLFNIHFVKTGVHGAEVARLAARLQKYREQADYAQSFPVDAAGARAELDEARGFVARLRAECESLPTRRT